MMSLSLILLQLITGLAYGMLYFMIATGLTITLGVMNVINLAHGTFFLIGSYITFMLVNHQFSFWVSLIITAVIIAVLGIIVEKFLIYHVYGKELEQVLLTFGLSYIFVDLSKMIWGVQHHTIATPEILDFSINLGGGFVFPAYRLFIILIGCLFAVILYYLEYRTRIGAIIRAGVDDREIIAALGINIGLVFTGVFAFGVALAGLGGGLGAPFLGVYSGLDSDILVTSLIVVVVGGLGSWKGSLIGAILIGIIETFTKAWFPAFSMVAVFIIMIIVLLIRPQGLFGREVEL